MRGVLVQVSGGINLRARGMFPAPPRNLPRAATHRLDGFADDADAVVERDHVDDAGLFPELVGVERRRAEPRTARRASRRPCPAPAHPWRRSGYLTTVDHVGTRHVLADQPEVLRRLELVRLDHRHLSGTLANAACCRSRSGVSTPHGRRCGGRQLGDRHVPAFRDRVEQHAARLRGGSAARTQ